MNNKVEDVFYTPLDLKRIADLYNEAKMAKEEKEGKEQLNKIMNELYACANKGLRSCFVKNLLPWTKNKLFASGFKIQDNSDELSNEYEISGW